jgi:nitroreductase
VTIEEVIRSRRSVRRYKREPLNRKVIERLIEIAVQAPSASTKQPWRFFVVDNRATIECMAVLVEEAVQKIVAEIDASFMDAFRKYGDYFVRFREAPALIVPIFRELDVLTSLLQPGAPECLRERIRVMEYSSGIISTSLAVENMMLYAHSIGLASSCMTGPLVAADKLREIIGVPPSWHLACVIAIGYPDEAPVATARKNAASVIRWVAEE